MTKDDQKDIIKGVVSKKIAKQTGDKLWVDWKKINLDQFTKGMNVEREHWSMYWKDTNITNDKTVPTGKIAWVHLKEIKKYYTWLKNMEDKYENK